MTTLSHEPEPLPTRDGDYLLCEDKGPFCELRKVFDRLYTISICTCPDTTDVNEINHTATIRLQPAEAAQIADALLLTIDHGKPFTRYILTLFAQLHRAKASFQPGQEATIKLDDLADMPTHLLAISIPSPEKSIPGITVLFERSKNGAVFQVSTDSDWILRKDLEYEDITFLAQTLKLIAEKRNPQLYDKLVGMPHH